VVDLQKKEGQRGDRSDWNIGSSGKDGSLSTNCGHCAIDRELRSSLSAMIWKTRIIRLSNLREMLALLIMLFGQGLANRNGAAMQFTIGQFSEVKTSP
jgi:hypothetical protein